MDGVVTSLSAPIVHDHVVKVVDEFDNAPLRHRGSNRWGVHVFEARSNTTFRHRVDRDRANRILINDTLRGSLRL